jgi:membrane associated rhomboid family serine protease
VRNGIFNIDAPQQAFSIKKRWISNVLIFGLISAATAVMLLCPCDVVGMHDYNAISLVALAGLFGLAAAYLVFRRMKRDSGLTAFLRALIALLIVGASVYLDLFLAMEMVALSASRK